MLFVVHLYLYMLIHTYTFVRLSLSSHCVSCICLLILLLLIESVISIKKKTIIISKLKKKNKIIKLNPNTHTNVNNNNTMGTFQKNEKKWLWKIPKKSNGLIFLHLFLTNSISAKFLAAVSFLDFISGLITKNYCVYVHVLLLFLCWME